MFFLCIEIVVFIASAAVLGTVIGYCLGIAKSKGTARERAIIAAAKSEVIFKECE